MAVAVAISVVLAVACVMAHVMDCAVACFVAFCPWLHLWLWACFVDVACHVFVVWLVMWPVM